MPEATTIPILDAALEGEIDRLLELPAGARAEALEQLALQQPERAAALRRWLAAIDASGGMLEDGQALSAVPQRIGPWQLDGLLGRGGNGEVYLGRRADGAFEREVAIKLLRADRDSASLITEERRLLARLLHPNIAGLLDGGVTGDGRPYLVAERVEGLPLDLWMEQTRPSLARRLAVYFALGSAVVHAHAHGVVHADLKPGNILVTAGDQPKLLDFGIARLIDKQTPASGVRMLTPSFAAPELYAGAEATPQSDIYALGLLLYLLLAGRLPEDTDTLTLAELRERRRQHDAPAPSLRSIALPARQLRGDLDAIVLRCLQRDPAARYASVQALLDDLAAWQAHRPVQARAGGGWYRVGRYWRRHWLALGLGGSALAALLIGSGLALWQAHQARLAHQQAQAISKFLGQLIVAGDLRTVRDPLLAVPSLLGEALARIEAAPLSPAADAEILVLLAEALYSHEEFARATRALDLADARAAAMAEPPLAAERARLRAELALIPLDYAGARSAIERARAALHGAPEPEALQLVDARLLAREGAVDRAIGTLDRLIAARAGRDGPLHVRTLAARLWKLEALRLARRPEALSFGQALLTDVESELPGNHALIPSVLQHLAVAELDRHPHDPAPERLDRAEQMLRRALAISLDLYGERSLAAINAHDGLALLLRLRGDNAGHLAELQRLLAAEQALFGADSVRAALTRFHVGMVRALDGDQGGEQDILAAADMVERHRAWQEVATIRQQWALLLAQGGDAGRALPAIDVALGALDRLEDPAPAMHASLQRARARLWLAQGGLDQALDAATQAIALAAMSGDDDDRRRSLKVGLRVAFARQDPELVRRWWTEVQALPVDPQDVELAELAQQWAQMQ